MSRIAFITLLTLSIAINVNAQSDTIIIADSLKRIAINDAENGNIEEGIPNIKRAIQIYQYKNHIPQIASSNYDLGLMYQRIQQLDSSNHYFKISRGYYKSAHVINKVFAINNQLLNNAIASKDLSTARQLYDKNQSLCQSIRVHQKYKMEFYQLGKQLGEAIDDQDLINKNEQKYNQLDRDVNRECSKTPY